MNGFPLSRDDLIKLEAVFISGETNRSVFGVWETEEGSYMLGHLRFQKRDHSWTFRVAVDGKDTYRHYKTLLDIPHRLGVFVGIEGAAGYIIDHHYRNGFGERESTDEDKVPVQ